MGAVDAQREIEQLFFANWTTNDVDLRTPVAQPNMHGLLVLVDTTDEDALIKQPPSDSAVAPWYGRWIRMSIKERGTGAANLGRQLLARKIGRLTFQVFVPVGVATSVARHLGDQAIAIFRGVNLENSWLQFDTGEDDIGSREVGRTSDGKWWQYNASITYFRDDYVDLEAM